MDYFSSNLKYLRTQRRLSQEALANSIGINRGNVDSYERTNTKPKPDIANKICKLFEVSLDDMFNKDLSKANDTGNASTIPKLPTGIVEKMFKLFNLIPEEKRTKESYDLLSEMIKEAGEINEAKAAELNDLTDKGE